MNVISEFTTISPIHEWTADSGVLNVLGQFPFVWVGVRCGRGAGLDALLCCGVHNNGGHLLHAVHSTSSQDSVVTVASSALHEQWKSLPVM